jgi:hypothetical protein
MSTDPAASNPSCELCGDQGPLLLHARCHLTAPLLAELDGDLLVLRCYVPGCRREVARFRVDRARYGKCGRRHHATDCECDGAGGDR